MKSENDSKYVREVKLLLAKIFYIYVSKIAGALVAMFYIIIKLIPINISHNVTLGFEKIMRRFPSSHMISQYILMTDRKKSCTISNRITELQKYDYFTESIKMTKVFKTCVVSGMNNKLVSGMNIDTNEMIVEMMKRIIRNNDKYDMYCEYTGKTWQPVEKLMLIRPQIVRREILNKSFWKKVFRNENIYHVVIEEKQHDNTNVK